MIKRTLEIYCERLALQYPVITITGPRQSGKTTLSKKLFPNKPYISLENPDNRFRAENDPKAFLSQFPDGAILDEIQRCGVLTSYIQTIVDEVQKEGLFVLTGSQQFNRMQSITQSLAGRTAIVKLLPFSIEELFGAAEGLALNNLLYSGLYPRIHDKAQDPTQAMGFYVNTYLERDVRQLINVKDLSKFELFLRLCAGRTGQVLNMNNIANEAGIDHNTVKSWLSVLEASCIITLLKPFHNNSNKRLVKSPKLYFIDTGLVCYLLNIFSPDHLFNHPLRGNIFETLIVSEYIKSRNHRVLPENLFFYRDNNQNEVDLILDNGSSLDLIEIKLAQTINDSFFKGLRFFQKNTKLPCRSYLVYGGEDSYPFLGSEVVSWKNLHSVFKAYTIW